MRLIDADALAKRLSHPDYYGVRELSDALCEVVYAPTIDAVPVKHGRWLVTKASIHPYGNDVKCSRCGHKQGSTFGYKYCPNCGAKMDEEDE